MKRKRPRIAFYTTLIVILIFSTVIYLGRSYKPSQEALDVYDATDVVIEEN